MIGVSVAAYGLAMYQAWWTIAFAVGGVAVALADWRRVRAVPAAIAGVATSIAVAVGMLGLFMVVVSQWSRGGGSTFLVLGIGALLLAIAALVVTRRYVRRSSVPSEPEPSPR